MQKNLAEAITNAIGRILEEFGHKSSILMIGRYNYDLYKLLRTEAFTDLTNNKIRCNKYPQANITYMTAHSSKGLGFDNVILVNMTESKFGFPCQIEDDPIIKLVTYEDTSIPFAEERRLFYVALTRTKNRVYIAAPLHRPSRFLVELIKDYKLPHPKEMSTDVVDMFKLRCPICNYPLKQEFNKNYGLRLHICTNDPEACDFMTNDQKVKKDIFKCPKCKDGYMIVKKSKTSEERFYGCTNYSDREDGCNNIMDFAKLSN
jgi:DNA helicase-4